MRVCLRVLSLFGLFACLTLCPAVCDPPADAVPESAEQDRILAAIRAYADRYESNLPNFICEQVTRQMEAGLKAKNWHKGDTLNYHLRFYEGQEQRNLSLVNGKPVERTSKRWRAPLQSEGEFGILFTQVLGENSRAFFTWSRWETVRDKRLAVFDFTVDKEHSTLRLSLSDLAHAILPYRGSVYADPQTGAVWRISDTVSDIPPALHTQEMATTVDYAQVPIGGKTYLLPAGASVESLLQGGRIRNEMEFRDYRKFEASSSITFNDADPTPKP